MPARTARRKAKESPLKDGGRRRLYRIPSARCAGCSGLRRRDDSRRQDNGRPGASAPWCCPAGLRRRASPPARGTEAPPTASHAGRRTRLLDGAADPLRTLAGRMSCTHHRSSRRGGGFDRTVLGMSRGGRRTTVGDGVPSTSVEGGNRRHRSWNLHCQSN